MLRHISHSKLSQSSIEFKNTTQYPSSNEHQSFLDTAVHPRLSQSSFDFKNSTQDSSSNEQQSCLGTAVKSLEDYLKIYYSNLNVFLKKK